MSGPFYFAWVNPNETTFNAGTMLRMDEDIFSFTIKHDEGQFATCEMIITNPRIGLLNAGRKLWAWIAYKKANGTVVPIFHGVLVGVPTDLFAELVTIKFNARPHDYIPRKQAVAETMKVRPYYDPVWLDEVHRDDPDAILEGWSKLYHIDRVTHGITASDILQGEDGTVTFDQTQGFYDSVKMTLGECPLDVVQVQASVQWTQRCTGFMRGPNVNVQSFTGSSFKGDWPKPGASLGGGWKCEASYVYDVLGTEHAKSASVSDTWQSTDPTSGDCSTESVSCSVTSCPVPGLSVDGQSTFQVGICDPTGIAADGSEGINQPAMVNTQGTSALIWVLNCRWFLRYDAKREFTEDLTINVQANVQDTVTSPTVDQNTEVMQVTGANVGLPLLSINAWSNYAGQFVGQATLIKPNDRTAVGGTSYQISVNSGTAGSVEPQFSDLPGDITIDGGVHWASLGTQPPTSQPAWTDSTPVPTGEIVLYEPKVFNRDSGAFETTGQSCFLLCTRGGTTNGQWSRFTYEPTITSNDDTLPLPVTTAYIAAPGQSSPFSAPIFGAGFNILDGTVVWTSLGISPPFLGIPLAGATTENCTARAYFASDRGRRSVEYLICKARARLRMRARCVKVNFEAPFEDCIDLSCRKNATLLDGRIPGGAATGKIVSYSLVVDQTGKLCGHVEIGCAVGFANSVPNITGTPEYVAPGYMQPGYQAYDGGQFSIAEEDIAYTPPAFAAFDDGLAFPLQAFPGTVNMIIPNQLAAVSLALRKESSTNLVASGVPVGGTSNNVSLMGGQNVGAYIEGLNMAEFALEAAPIACEILIHPVTNGPFNGSYVVDCTMLELPAGVNLAAPSSG